MTQNLERKDLVVLVADKDMEFAVRGLLSRGPSFGIRLPLFDTYVHPERDPGCFLRGHDFLRPFYRTYSYAMVMFDCEGSGRENNAREELERDVEDRLAKSGWDERAAAIAIDPELENWVWADSSHVEVALGWRGRTPGLREWLVEKGLLERSGHKPSRPKQAVEDALRMVRKSRSSALYLHLAQSVTLEGCTDKAFLKFRQTIINWFASPVP